MRKESFNLKCERFHLLQAQSNKNLESALLQIIPNWESQSHSSNESPSSLLFVQESKPLSLESSVICPLLRSLQSTYAKESAGDSPFLTPPSIPSSPACVDNALNFGAIYSPVQTFAILSGKSSSLLDLRGMRDSLDSAKDVKMLESLQPKSLADSRS